MIIITSLYILPLYSLEIRAILTGKAAPKWYNDKLKSKVGWKTSLSSHVWYRRSNNILLQFLLNKKLVRHIFHIIVMKQLNYIINQTNNSNKNVFLISISCQSNSTRQLFNLFWHNNQFNDIWRIVCKLRMTGKSSF